MEKLLHRQKVYIFVSLLTVCNKCVTFLVQGFLSKYILSYLILSYLILSYLRAVWANTFVGSEAGSRHYVILVYGTIGVWGHF